MHGEVGDATVANDAILRATKGGVAHCFSSHVMDLSSVRA